MDGHDKLRILSSLIGQIWLVFSYWPELELQTRHFGYITTLTTIHHSQPSTVLTSQKDDIDIFITRIVFPDALIVCVYILHLSRQAGVYLIFDDNWHCSFHGRDRTRWNFKSIVNGHCLASLLWNINILWIWFLICVSHWSITITST